MLWPLVVVDVSVLVVSWFIDVISLVVGVNILIIGDAIIIGAGLFLGIEIANGSDQPVSS